MGRRTDHCGTDTLRPLYHVTLQLEDFALLIGSVGLFVVLGAVMFLTRKIDWYAIAPAEEAGPEAGESIQS